VALSGSPPQSNGDQPAIVPLKPHNYRFILDSNVAEDYFQSIEKLAEVATTRVLRAETPEDVRAMLGIIAIAKGASNPRTIPRGLL
jgi:hypothetical protein